MMPKLQASSWGRNESICGGVDTPTGLDLGVLSSGDMDTDRALWLCRDMRLIFNYSVHL